MSLTRITAASLAIALAMLAGTNAAHAADEHVIDAVHSSVVFKIGHNGVGEVYGRFNEFNGSFMFDRDSRALESISVTVRAESVDTGNTRRDDHIKSPDFFNARQFRQITFTSTSITSDEAGVYDVVGEMSFHGVTKPVTAKLRFIGARNVGGQHRAGFSGELAINRSDFGVTFGIDNGMLGDEVTLLIAVQGVHQ